MDNGVETIKLQTRATAAWSQFKVCGRRLSLRPIGCTLTLCVIHKRDCSCGMLLVMLHK